MIICNLFKNKNDIKQDLIAGKFVSSDIIVDINHSLFSKDENYNEEIFKLLVKFKKYLVCDELPEEEILKQRNDYNNYLLLSFIQCLLIMFINNKLSVEDFEIYFNKINNFKYVITASKLLNVDPDNLSEELPIDRSLLMVKTSELIIKDYYNISKSFILPNESREALC